MVTKVDISEGAVITGFLADIVNETPTGLLRWRVSPDPVRAYQAVLQQEWVIHAVRGGLESSVWEWRDVPVEVVHG